MAKMKAKADAGGESRGKLPRRSPRGSTSSGRRLPWVRRLILLGIIVALLFWQWAALASWYSSIVDGARELFGWGLLIIAIAVGVLVGLIVERKLSSLVDHWNRWLGGIAFDRTGSYDAIWWASVALGVFAALMHMPIREQLAKGFENAAA